MEAIASLYGSDDDDDDSDTAATVDEIPVLTEDEARRRRIFARNVPHTVGNWATHIYLDLTGVDSPGDEDESDDDDRDDEGGFSPIQHVACRDRWIRRLSDDLRSHRAAVPALVSHEDWHVSLSKTFYLQQYNMESFVDSLRRALTAFRGSSLTVRVDAHPAVVLSNAMDSAQRNATDTADLRTFWCAPVHPKPILTELVSLVDGVLKAWRLPPFYDPPLFHTSWASAPGDWTGTAVVPSLPRESLVFTVQHVTCRIGDRIFRIPLSSSEV